MQLFLRILYLIILSIILISCEKDPAIEYPFIEGDWKLITLEDSFYEKSTDTDGNISSILITKALNKDNTLKTVITKGNGAVTNPVVVKDSIISFMEASINGMKHAIADDSYYYKLSWLDFSKKTGEILTDLVEEKRPIIEKENAEGTDFYFDFPGIEMHLSYQDDKKIELVFKDYQLESNYNKNVKVLYVFEKVK